MRDMYFVYTMGESVEKRRLKLCEWIFDVHMYSTCGIWLSEQHKCLHWHLLSQYWQFISIWIFQHKTILSFHSRWVCSRRCVHRHFPCSHRSELKCVYPAEMTTTLDFSTLRFFFIVVVTKKKKKGRRKWRYKFRNHVIQDDSTCCRT